MAAQADNRQLEGVVREALPNGMFRVRAEDGATIVGTLSASLRQFAVKVLPGDRVTIEVSAYDPSRGRIVRRLK
ncbi:MAG: translation initiation factor IF-1 [Deltaproteobacteria bacterium]|jgi:translation initiation factor IF-1|nr:translation initiation factor IF-1 [Deltaproteobacteria bacterium]MBW2529936.1 translation initiation factor IF-1 [Deltaproteobacteria bacterium]